MIDLYAAGTSNGTRARIALEERGLKYNWHPIDLTKGEPKKPHAPTAEMFKQRLQGYFKVWNDLLAKRKYAAGDEFSIADLSLYAGYWRTKGAFPELLQGMANLKRWAGELAARLGVQRALKI